MNVSVRFYTTDSGTFAAEVNTPRLRIRSVTSDDFSNYCSLYCDPVLMEKFGDGTAKSPEEVRRRIEEIWIKRWENKDPVSAFSIFEGTKFIGHVVLAHGEQPETCVVSALFLKEFWAHGYATEAAMAFIDSYVPSLPQIKRIRATARPDNLGSCRVLEKMGMKKVGEEERYGALRYFFEKEL